jgi:large subunit ribosomal protein L23
MALLGFFKKPKKEKIPLPPRGRVGKGVKRERKVEPRKGVLQGAEEKREKASAPAALKESRTAWRILRAPHVTEKSSDLTRFNHYTFRVIGNPSKPDIKKSVEEVYGVHVERVRKISLPGKQRRRGRHLGWKSGYKKAIVILRQGEKIEVLPH